MAKKGMGSQHLPYRKARANLTVDPSGLLLCGSRIVVPTVLRRETPAKIHGGHQGVQQCRLWAKISVWWHGISCKIESTVRQCHICAKQFTPRREPLKPSELPQFPWKKVAVDLFHLKGANYIILVDYFSRFPEVEKLTSTTSGAIIDWVKFIFSRFGIPEMVVSDNGLQFTSRLLSDFANTYSFQHITSSPLFPQSNGQIKRTVQTV